MSRNTRRRPKTMIRNTIIQKMDQLHNVCPRLVLYFQLLLAGLETGDKVVHALVAVMAKARVSKQNIAWGRGEDTEKPCLSIETAYLRQRLFWTQASVENEAGEQ